jgi:DNA-binding response OmpR family regulator
MTAKKILVVDDELHIATAVQFLLDQEGFTTTTASNGAEAVEKAKAFTPDLIVMDVMMPIMDGFEAAMEIRKDESMSDMKIIFLTAKTTEQDKLQGYRSGADWYLTKPFDNEDLIERVRDLV